MNSILKLILLVTNQTPSTLVQSAEMNFSTKSRKANENNQNQNQSKKNKQTKFVNKSFSKELKDAYKIHKIICSDWRKAGRPKDNSNPFKKLKLNLREICKILGGMRIPTKHKIHTMN